MNDYYASMFYVPLLHLEVRDWNNKKQKLKEIYNNTNITRHDEIFTDFPYVAYNKIIHDDVGIILSQELELFKNHFKFKNYNIIATWFEKSGKGDYHEIHDHGSFGYSAVCFIDYDPNQHTSTKFVSPFKNFLRQGNLLYYNPQVNEGSIIFFPSSILHYTNPNKSDKERMVLSFNLKIEEFDNC